MAISELYQHTMPGFIFLGNSCAHASLMKFDDWAKEWKNSKIPAGCENSIGSI